MSFNLDDVNIGGQLKVGTGICPAIGEGAIKTNGSALIEGPIVMGNPTTFPNNSLCNCKYCSTHKFRCHCPPTHSW